jgi:hypothetical protein
MEITVDVAAAATAAAVPEAAKLTNDRVASHVQSGAEGVSDCPLTSQFVPMTADGFS